MMMLPIMAMAQLPHFAKLGEKYNGMEGVTAMTVNKQMIAMFAGENADFDFVDEIQILLCEDAGVASNIVKDAKKAVKKSKIERTSAFWLSMISLALSVIALRVSHI